jgi:ketosteroid isomerase-like protein
MSNTADVVLKIFRAVEERDRDTVLALYHPDVEFYDAPSLPYGGSRHGFEAVVGAAWEWAETWDPVQHEAERKMDPQVVATHDDQVVVLYRQRAVDAEGHRLDAPVLGLYRVRDDKLQRAQMFHFDTAAIVRFLHGARRAASASPDDEDSNTI